MPTPLPVLPAVYYGYVWGTYLGRKTGSIFTWKCSAVPSTETEDAFNAQTIANAMVTAWNTNMVPRYPNAYTGTDARVYALGHPTVPPAFAHTTSAGAAGITVAPVPAAAVIRHNVFRRGRGSQSHTAISPLMKAEITDDGTAVTGAFITNMDTDFGNFIGDTQAGFVAISGGPTIDFVQLSKKGSGATYTITSSQTEALLGTERSRTLRP